METQTGKESALHEPTTARGETSLFMGVTVDFLLSRLDKTNPKQPPTHFVAKSTENGRKLMKNIENPDFGALQIVLRICKLNINSES